MTPQDRKTEILSRKCGPCYACCTYLGISELKKFPGQHCKHLDGSLGAETRCSIYEDRPKACETYKCGWLQGLGNPQDRPNQSGLLVTPYHPNQPDSGTMSATIIITDKSKCGTINDPTTPLCRVLQDLIMIHCNDIRILSYDHDDLIHILNGNIYRGKRLKTPNHEELKFMTFNPPIGKYHLQDKDPNQ